MRAFIAAIAGFRCREGHGALPLALGLSIALTTAAVCASPYRNELPDMRPAWWPRDHIVKVYVCDPPKDQARIVPGMMIPKLVKTQSFMAADVSPAQQAAESKPARKRNR